MAHLVGGGIDTGNILYQKSIKGKEDYNFHTYSYLQVGEGLRMKLKAIQDNIDGEIKKVKNSFPSHLYIHPTIVQYLWRRNEKR